MDRIKYALKQLGLKEEEVAAYITALKSGPISIHKLAQITKIPRATLYLVIKVLQNKGLVTHMVSGKRKKIISAPPDKLIELAEERRLTVNQAWDNIQQALPQLQIAYDQVSGRPRISYYEGTDAVKTLYEQTLSSDEIFIHSTRPTIKTLEKYFIRIGHKMIRSKAIVTDSKENKRYQREFTCRRCEILCIKNEGEFDMDYIIFDNRVAFISYKNFEPMGMVIEDKNLAEFEKMRFLTIWKIIKDEITTLSSGGSVKPE